MAPKRTNTVAAEPTADIPLSTDFCADDADVIIRAAGSLDFHVHKLILSLVSPFFRDLFTLPQPPSNTPEALPHVDVHESPETWENILRTIYPTTPNPTIDTLDDLESLIFAAQAYEMHTVIEAHKKAFENRAFVEGDPLHLFSIACTCGFEDLATYVARNAELLAVTRRFGSGAPKGLTFDAYGRLLSFLAERDNEWQRVLRKVMTPWSFGCGCCNKSVMEQLYGDIKKDLHRYCLQTKEIYINALERRRESGCEVDGCPLENWGLKKLIEEFFKERERVYNKFQPVKWYYKFTTTFHPNSLVDIIFIRFGNGE